MAVKRKLEKRRKKNTLYKYSMKLLCIYCLIRGVCIHSSSKEKAELLGIKTRCILTPNRTIKHRPWEIVNSKGETININKHGIPMDRRYQNYDT